MKVVESLLSNCKVQVQGNKDQYFFCSACQLGKAHKLPLNHSTSMTTEPLELTYSDI